MAYRITGRAQEKTRGQKGPQSHIAVPAAKIAAAVAPYPGGLLEQQHRLPLRNQKAMSHLSPLELGSHGYSFTSRRCSSVSCLVSLSPALQPDLLGRNVVDRTESHLSSGQGIALFQLWAKGISRGPLGEIESSVQGTQQQHSGAVQKIQYPPLQGPQGTWFWLHDDCQSRVCETGLKMPASPTFFCLRSFLFQQLSLGLHRFQVWVGPCSS